VIDFPIEELFNEQASTIWLERNLHPGRSSPLQSLRLSLYDPYWDYLREGSPEAFKAGAEESFGRCAIA